MLDIKAARQLKIAIKLQLIDENINLLDFTEVSTARNKILDRNLSHLVYGLNEILSGMAKYVNGQWVKNGN